MFQILSEKIMLFLPHVCRRAKIYIFQTNVKFSDITSRMSINFTGKIVFLTFIQHGCIKLIKRDSRDCKLN